MLSVADCAPAPRLFSSLWVAPGGEDGGGQVGTGAQHSQGLAGKGCLRAGTLPRRCQAVPGVGSTGRGWDVGQGTHLSAQGQGGASRCAAPTQQPAGTEVCHLPLPHSDRRGTRMTALSARAGAREAPGRHAQPRAGSEPCAPTPLREELTPTSSTPPRTRAPQPTLATAVKQACTPPQHAQHAPPHRPRHAATRVHPPQTPTTACLAHGTVERQGSPAGQSHPRDRPLTLHGVSEAVALGGLRPRLPGQPQEGGSRLHHAEIQHGAGTAL